MNKTIIDGIDVSECENHFIYKSQLGLGTHLQCRKELYGRCEGNNCMYKQLKRLQEENEELKKYQYTQEYLQSEIEKRQKALEEIRDIAQIHQYFNPELLEIKGDIGQMQDLKMTEIFKKCNEVLK